MATCSLVSFVYVPFYTPLIMRNFPVAGNIPPELSELVNLEKLVLGGNQLSGKFCVCPVLYTFYSEERSRLFQVSFHQLF